MDHIGGLLAVLDSDPDPGVLNRLKGIGVKLYRADERGHITMAVPVPVTMEKINPAPSSDIEIMPQRRGLKHLFGIGQAKAQLIIAGRPYATVDNLIRIRGIGPKTLEKLRPRITIE